MFKLALNSHLKNIICVKSIYFYIQLINKTIKYINTLLYHSYVEHKNVMCVRWSLVPNLWGRTDLTALPCHWSPSSIYSDAM